MNKKMFTIIVVAILLTSCTRIPYKEVVYPVFKQKHPQADISQIFPIGGYGADSAIGKQTDIVIVFRENGSALEEIWTVTRTRDWLVQFKCKSAGNVCVKNDDKPDKTK